MSESTDKLLSSLVDDLAPVKPVPPLRIAFGWVVGLASIWAGVILGSSGAPMGAASLFADTTYFLTCIGLIAVALGGTLAAIASGRPGRESLVNLGRIVSLLGLGVATSACGIGLVNLGLTLYSSPPGWDGICFRAAMKYSVLPVAVVAVFVIRGWSQAPMHASLVALASAGAIGGLVTHLSCEFLEPQHLLLGHVSVPIALAVLGFYPLGILIRRLRG